MKTTLVAGLLVGGFALALGPRAASAQLTYLSAFSRVEYHESYTHVLFGPVSPTNDSDSSLPGNTPLFVATSFSSGGAISQNLAFDPLVPAAIDPARLRQDARLFSSLAQVVPTTSLSVTYRAYYDAVVSVAAPMSYSASYFAAVPGTTTTFSLQPGTYSLGAFTPTGPALDLASLPNGTLSPGVAYRVFADFSNTLVTTEAFDFRPWSEFAVPTPGATVMLALAGALVTRRRR